VHNDTNRLDWMVAILVHTRSHNQILIAEERFRLLVLALGDERQGPNYRCAMHSWSSSRRLNDQCIMLPFLAPISLVFFKETRSCVVSARKKSSSWIQPKILSAKKPRLCL
jgi:hypothetical protein